MGDRVSEIRRRAGLTQQELSDPAAHANVPWRAMKATRNLVAHQYEIIDYDLVWSVMEDRLPQNAAAMRTILDDMG